MYSFKTIAAFALLAASVSAAPTKTTYDAPSGVQLTGVTHSVVAGLGGLHFDPDNVVAQVGDVVEWHYLPKNHSVAQASFAKPCEPLAGGDGFFAGFNFAVEENQSDKVFQIVVEDTKPIWYYCPQQKGDHCQMGMVGVINQNFDNQDFSLSKFRDAAELTKKSVIPPNVQGGKVIKNPNPLSGF